MALSDIFVLIMAASCIGGFATRMFRRKQLLSRALEPSSEWPAVTVLLPCYLPNEQSILLETVEHIMTRLEYPGSLTLIVCYNTPERLPIEDELIALDHKQYENGRLLRVLPVAGSKSKAQNW